MYVAERILPFYVIKAGVNFFISGNIFNGKGFFPYSRKKYVCKGKKI